MSVILFCIESIGASDLPLGSTSASAQGYPESRNLAAFKSFVGEPSNISALDFSAIFSKGRTLGFTTGVEKAATLMWRGNAYFISQIDPRTGKPPIPLPSQEDTLFAAFSGNMLAYVDIKNDCHIWINPTNSSSVDAYFSKSKEMHEFVVDRVLCLGIGYARPGTIRWIGNSFSATNTYSFGRQLLRGSIVDITNGLPSEIQFEQNTITDKRNFTNRFRLTYSYAFTTRTNSLIFPMNIESEVLVDGNWEPRFRMKIARCVKGSQPTNLTAKDAIWPFVRGQGRNVYYHTNGVMAHPAPERSSPKPLPVSGNLLGTAASIVG